MKRAIAILATAFAFSLAVPAGTAQAVGVVNNFCYHPTYAPGGTNKPVTMRGPGFAKDIPCGQSKGNVYEVEGYNTAIRVKTSRGSEFCVRANFPVQVPTDSRVWSVNRC